MSPLAELIIAVLLPTAVGYAIVMAFRGGRRVNRARYSSAAPEPIERLTARIRRLRAELEQTEARPGATAKSHHIRALRGAYVDVLSEACGRLGIVPPQGGDRAPLTDIYRVEAALRSRGLDVRQRAAQ